MYACAANRYYRPAHRIQEYRLELLMLVGLNGAIHQPAGPQILLLAIQL